MMMLLLLIIIIIVVIIIIYEHKVLVSCTRHYRKWLNKSLRKADFFPLKEVKRLRFRVGSLKI